MISELPHQKAGTETVVKRRDIFMNRYESRLLGEVRIGTIRTLGDLLAFEDMFMKSLPAEERDIAWINHKQAHYDIEMRQKALVALSNLGVVEPDDSEIVPLERARCLLRETIDSPGTPRG